MLERTRAVGIGQREAETEDAKSSEVGDASRHLGVDRDAWQYWKMSRPAVANRVQGVLVEWRDGGGGSWALDEGGIHDKDKGQ